MKLQVIKNKVEESRYPGGVKALADAVGMTEQNLHRCVRENKMQAQDLENIAKELKVSVLCFFDENIETEAKFVNLQKKISKAKIIEGNNNQLNFEGAYGNSNNCSDSILQERIKSLEALLAEKNERINELKERIEELKAK